MPNIICHTIAYYTALYRIWWIKTGLGVVSGWGWMYVGCLLSHCTCKQAIWCSTACRALLSFYEWYPLSKEVLWSQKSLNALALYSPMRHSYIKHKCVHLFSKWCIVGYGQVRCGTCAIVLLSLHTEAHIINRFNHLKMDIHVTTPAEWQRLCFHRC